MEVGLHKRPPFESVRVAPVRGVPLHTATRVGFRLFRVLDHESATRACSNGYNNEAAAGLDYQLCAESCG